MPRSNHQNENIDSHSVFNDLEIQEMIGNPPNWILRSGIGLVFLVASIGIALCFVIKYPEKIEAPILITTENPPIAIVAKVNGTVEKVFVKDKKQVEAGTPIAYINNAARASDVVALQHFFRQFDEADQQNDYLNLSFPKQITVGEFQNEATAFEQKLSEFKTVLLQKSTQEQIQTLGSELQKIKELNQVLNKEKELFLQELAFVQKEKERYKNLNQSKAVSDSEYEQKEVAIIKNQRELERMKRDVIRNKIRMEELRTNQLKLSEERQNSINDYRFGLIELKNRIVNKIIAWEDKYYLEATVAGVINLSPELVESAPIRADQHYAHIIPGNQAGSIMARATVSISGIGKIQNGDKALLRLDPYPYKEFGSVESQVNDISIIPSIEEDQSFYTLRIPVGEVIKTNYDKVIPYRPNMTGMVLIITKDKSLFHRIFEQFTSLIKN